MTTNINNKHFELEVPTKNPYEIYDIGDVFHNDNGDDYIIIALNKASDKALLTKKVNKTEKQIIGGKVIYIGARGLGLHDWCHGHYFMTDFLSAVQWFVTEEVEVEIAKEAEKETVKKKPKKENSIIKFEVDKNFKFSERNEPPMSTENIFDTNNLKAYKIHVKGYKGYWNIVEEDTYEGIGTFYLLEHNTWGDEVGYIFINAAGELVLEDVYNSCLDLEELFAYKKIRFNSLP